MHSSKQIANWFIENARQSGNTLTPMQLLKLVYIAHGWMLGLYGVPLIRDKIEAWKFGPVIPSLYHSIKQYRDGPVIDVLSCEDVEFVEIELNLLEQVADAYGKESGIALSELTHMRGTPWAMVYEPYESNIPISNDLIEEHYRNLASNEAA